MFQVPSEFGVESCDSQTFNNMHELKLMIGDVVCVTKYTRRDRDGNWHDATYKPLVDKDFDQDVVMFEITGAISNSGRKTYFAKDWVGHYVSFEQKDILGYASSNKWFDMRNLARSE